MLPGQRDIVRRMRVIIMWWLFIIMWWLFIGLLHIATVYHIVYLPVWITMAICLASMGVSAI